MITDEARRAAQFAYTETLTELRLSEGGGLKVASQHRRALDTALEAAAPHVLAAAWDGAYQSALEDEGLNRATTPNPYRSQA